MPFDTSKNLQNIPQEINFEVDRQESIVEQELVVEQAKEESIEWTGFNFIDVYHFCPDAQHVLNHHTITIPGVGIIYRGTTIYKKDNKYFIKETR